MKARKGVAEESLGDIKWRVDENEDDFKHFYQADISSSQESKRPVTLVQLKKSDEYLMDDSSLEGSGGGTYNQSNYGKCLILN